MNDAKLRVSSQEEAATRKQREIANNLLRAGLPIEIVARVTGLLIEEVQQLQQQLNEFPQS